MKHLLFVDADTALEFSSRAKAFIYVDKNQLKSWMLLTIGYSNGEASIYNPFAKSLSDGIEYFKTENEALKCIGSFLS